jgi:hypothetical protein
MIQIQPSGNLKATLLDATLNSSLQGSFQNFDKTFNYTKVSRRVDDNFVASMPNYSDLINNITNAGLISIFQSDILTSTVIGTDQNKFLGEYIWIAKDTSPGKNDENIIIAASYQISDKIRSINLYKMASGNLTLWQ